MAAAVTLDRARWLGYRWHRHGLDGGGHGSSATRRQVLDDLLLLGFQGSGVAGAQQSLIQRTRRIGSVGVPDAISPTGPLASLWSVRGAPHPEVRGERPRQRPRVALAGAALRELRQVDRTRLVPDRTRRSVVWRALSAPGALLVDGEVAGTWRYRLGDGRLTITAFPAVCRAAREG